jgi:transposase
VLFHHVKEAHQQIEVTEVTQLTVDETSVRRGHNYVTVVCEPGCPEEKRTTRVLFVAEGREATEVEKAKIFLEAHGLPSGQVREVCADMSPSYAKGIREQFPEARLVFDFFHVVQLLTTAVDAVRRRESARFPQLLRGTRYLWLKNEDNLSE